MPPPRHFHPSKEGCRPPPRSRSPPPSAGVTGGVVGAACDTAAMKVLIADDHRLMLDGVKRALEEDGGFEIVGETQNGAQVLPLVGQTSPDLVVLDVRMPELDGWETLERLRDLSEVPVLMHSGQKPTDDQLARLRPDVDDYIRKPAQGPELTTRVDELLVGHVPA
jgi:DNA-binding NarL/FixJ family response regulator